MNNSKYWRVIYSVAILLSVGIGVVFGLQRFSSPPLVSAQLLPAAVTLPSFALVDQRGKNINSARMQDKWTLVFFGFTSCPDICPLELQTLSKLLRLADNKTLQVVFISVDPERDSREKLAEYTAFFHPQIIALRGKNAELARAANFFGAAYDRSVIIDNKILSIPAGIDMPTNAGDTYQVNHSTRFFIVDPQGQFIGSFAPPHDAEKLLQDMLALIKAH